MKKFMPWDLLWLIPFMSGLPWFWLDSWTYLMNHLKVKFAYIGMVDRDTIWLSKSIILLGALEIQMNMLWFFVFVNTLSLSFAFVALFLNEYAMLCLVWTETSKLLSKVFYYDSARYK